MNIVCPTCGESYKTHGTACQPRHSQAAPAPWLDAGSAPASPRRYNVTWPHDHPTLKTGDEVVMVESPRPEMRNWLLRVSDMTLHPLKDENDQYVHLVAASNDQS